MAQAQPIAAPVITGAVHRYSVMGSIFDVPDRYELQHAIGQGAYGVVVSAMDKTTSRKVAIKKVTQVFEHPVDAKRMLREVKLLRHFRHENIVPIVDLLAPPAFERFDDIYMVLECLDTDLGQIVRSQQPLSDEHVQYFMYQILRGVQCIHSANVLHRDLKPSNILMNANCDLKICDFGLARPLLLGENEHELTEYVATRWYRAPELLMQWRDYGKSVDMWSIGCILYELLARKPLFPGKNYVDQMQKIVETLGSPTDADLHDIGSEKARRYLRSLPKYPATPFEALLPSGNPHAIDLLKKLLKFDYSTRLSVEQALAHPYLASMADPADEARTSPPDFSFENAPLDVNVLKRLIYDEIRLFHPEAPPRPAAAAIPAPAAAPSVPQVPAPAQTVVHVPVQHGVGASMSDESAARASEAALRSPGSGDIEM